MFKKLSKIKFAIAVCAILFSVLTLLAFLNITIKNNLSKTVSNSLDEIMRQQAYNFTAKLRDERFYIKSLGAVLAKTKNVNDISTETLNAFARESDFEYISVSDEFGYAFSNNESRFYIGDMSFFLHALTGDTIISEPFTSRIRPIKVITISSPIIFEDKIIGVIMGSYSTDKLNSLLLSSFDGNGYAYITSSKGDIIAESLNDYSIASPSINFIADLESAKFTNGDDFKTITNNLADNRDGFSEYLLNGKKCMMRYSSIGINNWHIFAVIPEEIILTFTSDISFLVLIFSVLFAFVMISFFFWLWSNQKAHLKELSDIAFIDSLTGAPTLLKFKIDAQSILDKNPDTKYLLVINDIDRFKLINQTLGYAEGDRMLRNMAHAMEHSMCSDKETYARFNIDEFILLHEYISEEHLINRRQVFVDAFHSLTGDDYSLSFKFPSGHYYLFTEGTRDINVAIERANIAHRKAKQQGMEICVYDESMTQEALNTKNIESRMEVALINGEFQLFLQRKWDLTDETPAGAEALARWKYDGKSYKMPAEFIPIFEQNGFITRLDMFIFEETCRYLRTLIEHRQEPFHISVNFSRKHLYNKNLVSELCDIADRYLIPHDLLEIEITETTIMNNQQALVDLISELHCMGFHMSMDDFGTGYSSLGLLRNLPVNVLKLDRSFFIDNNDAERTHIVLSNVIKMSKELGIKTVAEGIELREHVEYLREIGCDMVQGYYFSKPVPADEL